MRLGIFVAVSLFQGVLQTRFRMCFCCNSIRFVELATNQVVGGSIPSGRTIESTSYKRRPEFVYPRYGVRTYQNSHARGVFRPMLTRRGARR